MLLLLCTGALQNVTLLIPDNPVFGQSLVLTCEMHSSLPITPNLLSVLWLHRGSPVNATGSDESVLALVPGTVDFIYIANLTLIDTSVDHSGLYTCVVSMDIDRQQETAEGNLTLTCDFCTHTLHTPCTVSYINLMKCLCPGKFLE